MSRIRVPAADVARLWTVRLWTGGKSTSKLWRVRLLVTAAMLLATQAGAAEVIAKASSDSVQVAQPFTLNVTVTAPAAAKVSFPAAADKLGDFDIRDSDDAFDIPAGDERTWTRQLTLETIATGELQIPAIDIQVNEGGKSTLLQTQPVAVRVASVLEDRSDPTKFRDIQSVVDVEVPEVTSTDWVWWALGGAAGMTLFAIAGMVVSRRGEWLTPRDWALAELSELESSVDASAIDSETASQNISEVVRSYLLLQFGIADAGCTPQELVQQIVASKRINTDAIDRLGALFALADKARFAGLELSAIGLQSAINDSRELIQQITNEYESSRSRQTLGDASSTHPISGEIGDDNESETN